MRPTLPALLILCVATANGATRTVPMARVVESLIADLGDERYQVRERATAALRKIGFTATEPLEAAARSDDPEVRMRARDVLRDVRLGIGPRWPAEVVLIVRHFDQQPNQMRHEALRRVAALGTSAVPFLVRRIAKGDPSDAGYALNFLQSNPDPRAAEIALTLLKGPQNDYTAQAIAWAKRRKGDALPAFTELVEKRLPADLAKKTADPLVQQLLAKLRDEKPREAADAAAQAIRTRPDDTRFLYLQSLALQALDHPEKAAEARQKALKAQPRDQLPHYLAARMLTDIGRYRFAVPEWRKVLDMPPDDTPLDIAANVALYTIHSENGLFETAADYLAKALEKAAKTAGDNPIPQPTIQGVHAELSRLRSYGSRYPQQGIVVEDRIPEKEVGVEVVIEAQDGTTEELRAALASASLHLQLVAGSPPMRLLDVASVSFRYDKAKESLDILLGGEPACEPVPFEPPTEKARFAVHCADAAHLFRLCPDGTCEQLARYTMNYRLKLTLGPRLRICTAHSLLLGSRAYEWEKAKEGIPLDTLPDRLRLTVQATSPAGPRITVRRTLTLSEPLLITRFLQQKATETPKPE